MNEQPFSQRSFAFHLADWLPYRYHAYLRWLNRMLERLGRDRALAVWQDVVMACSTDEAAYRAFNPSLRLQRSATLMEGAGVCDFHIYAA